MSAFFFEYDAANDIMAGRFNGDVNDDVFRAFYDAARKRLAASGARTGFADFSGATSFDLSMELIKEIAETAPLIADPTPRFIVAPPDHIFGTARMMQLMSPGRRETLHVVRTESEVYIRLGITSPKFERLD